MRPLRLLLLGALLAAAGAALATGLAAAPAAARTADTTTPTTTSACPTPNAPNDLRLVSGSPQTAKIGSPFGSNLQVAVVDSHGCPLTVPLSGISVTFTAPTSGASGTFGSSGSTSVTVGTDANGIATAPGFIANQTEGDYSVKATSAYGSVTFSLHNTASGVAASVSATAGTPQSATVNRQYAQPLQARVLDAHGNPVSGVTVAFSVGGGGQGPGASFLGGGGQASAQTDGSGVATSPPVVANGAPGPFTATASVAGISGVATYSLDNHAAVYTVAPGSSAELTASVYGRFAAALKVRVLDDTGSPSEGTTVTFSLEAGPAGAGATFAGGGAQATAVTDASGTATSPGIVANGTPGRFRANATVSGGTAPAGFSLRNLAATLKTAQPRLAGRVNGRYAERLRARLVGADGGPIEGVTVTFALGKSSDGATATFPDGSGQATATTSRAGWAVSPALTAGATAGSFTATASTPGTRTLVYGLRNQAGRPFSIAAGAASGQTTTAGTRFPIRLAVTVKDEKGNAVAGAVVVFTAPKNGPGAVFANRRHARTVRVHTNSRGIAIAPALVANGSPGGYVVTARVAGTRLRAAFALVNAGRS
jgi:protocatechuate 3,4-dioxygenase beta subunit